MSEQNLSEYCKLESHRVVTKMIGLLQVPASSDAHPGLSHLILVLELSESQGERFRTVPITL